MSGYRKKLIEVGLPLVAINAESAREKSIRHGHPSTLHLWWARRPLAACRAVLFASLVDDPDSDPQYLKADGSVDEEGAAIKRADLFNLIEELVMWENSNNVDVIRSARTEIARCVASRLIETGAMKKDTVIGANTTANDLVQCGHCRPNPMGVDTKVGRVRFSFDVSRLPPAEVVNAFLAEHAPPVLDPFAGGGSIPLEAQRLGLRAYASDLNPVPVLINKALIEIPPKFAGRPPVNPESQDEGLATKGKGKTQRALMEKKWSGVMGLAEDVRYYGQWIRDEAEKRIGHLYPKAHVSAEVAQDRPDLLPYVGQQLTVIAWLWARTIPCPNPACEFSIPLIRSFTLSTKRNGGRHLEAIVERKLRSITFQIRSGAGDPAAGTMKNRAATCIACDTSIPVAQIRSVAQAGLMGKMMIAIVADSPSGRIYLPADEMHVERAGTAVPSWKPDQFVTTPCHDVDRLPMYGMATWGDAFSPRQLVALSTHSDLLGSARHKIMSDANAASLPTDPASLENGGRGATAYADAIVTYLAIGVSKMADYNNALVSWIKQRDQAGHLFSKHVLPMNWDYCEVNPLVGAAGDITVSLGGISKVIETLPLDPSGLVEQRDARAAPEWAPSFMYCTDPPYYDNVGYAELSDFFYVWLRKSLSRVLPQLFSTVLTPKEREIVAASHRFGGNTSKARDYFEGALGEAFRTIRGHQRDDFPFTVFYAFKQSEVNDDDQANYDDEIGESVATSTGWETMLEGLMRGGFSVSGTWPVRSERGARAIAMGTNALASSIVLVCRPRPDNASLATRKEFITALRRELPEALRNLQRGNIAPVDLAQAAIGPGMAVFTRYAKVLESDGSPMTVRTALGLINQSLDEVLAEQEGEFDGDTRWALAWFDQFGMEEGPFGDAETLSKAKNTAVNGLVEAGIVTARAGKVRLVSRDELPVDWNPTTDKRLTIWEITQYLIQRLDQQGESGAATLVRQLGGMAEVSRDLAYRLYSTCERKKWAQDALAYNSLVVAWSELTKLALMERGREREQQQDLFRG